MIDQKTHAGGKIIEEISRLISLKKEYLKLDILEKGGLLLSNMVLIIAALLLGCFALLCLSFALAYLLGAWLGSFILAFLIVALLYIVLIIILIRCKETLVINPIIRILANSIFKHKNEVTHETDEA